jgi:glutamate racemase
VRVIDPAPAVARQTVRVLQEKGIPTGEGTFSIDLYHSGEPDSLQRIYQLVS